jgi:hypothetical protein
MGLFAAVALYRRGKLLGGAERKAMIQAANTWMVNQKLKAPIA